MPLLTRQEIAKLLAGTKPVELACRNGAFVDLRKSHLDSFDDDPYEVAIHPHIVVVKERKHRRKATSEPLRTPTW